MFELIKDFLNWCFYVTQNVGYNQPTGEFYAYEYDTFFGDALTRTQSYDGGFTWAVNDPFAIIAGVALILLIVIIICAIACLIHAVYLETIDLAAQFFETVGGKLGEKSAKNIKSENDETTAYETACNG